MLTVRAHTIAVHIAFVFLSGWLLIGSLHAPPSSEIRRDQATAEAASKNHKGDQLESFWQRTFNDPTAFFTLWVAAFTAILSFSTMRLWFVTRIAASAALRQANVMIGVESPMPLIVGFNIVQYSQIPGETVVADPYRGPIQADCRFLFCIENKGRAPLPLLELCIEKFAGTTLPQRPAYIHVAPWGLVLEKGPIWIRADDAMIEITPADATAAAAAYRNNGAFWVYGYFAYRNLLSERVEHKFLARWDLTNGFMAENRPAYT
jgi:hypothetical protein